MELRVRANQLWSQYVINAADQQRAIDKQAYSKHPLTVDSKVDTRGYPDQRCTNTRHYRQQHHSDTEEKCVWNVAYPEPDTRQCSLQEPDYCGAFKGSDCHASEAIEKQAFVFVVEWQVVKDMLYELVTIHQKKEKAVKDK